MPIYHYQPEVLKLLIEVIPLLNRSKNDVFTFLKGAGVEEHHFLGSIENFQRDRKSVTKYDIVREALENINAYGDKELRTRREIVKRVVEFEDFSLCWEDDQYKARGLVSELQKIVKVKDSFSRMNQEREQERKKNTEKHQKKIDEKKRYREKIRDARDNLFALFSETDPHKRGKKLEGALNQIFEVYGISIRNAFELRNIENGVSEQIDGVIELDGENYLVEMKWLKEATSPKEISQHLVRVFNRVEARGLFISASGYTPAAIKVVEESLSKAVFVLADLEEIVHILDREDNLSSALRKKVRAAVVDKKPLLKHV